MTSKEKKIKKNKRITSETKAKKKWLLINVCDTFMNENRFLLLKSSNTQNKNYLTLQEGDRLSANMYETRTFFNACDNFS